MLNETITQSHILLPGVEQSFGILLIPHPLTEIVVDGNGATAANNSEWRLYNVTPTGAALIWSGDLDRIDRAQRLTPVGGISSGSRVELRGFSRSTEPTAVQVKASLVGYDPDCCAEPPLPPLTIAQPDWYVDPENGDDAYDGATALTALKTFAELTRRLGIFNLLAPTGGVLSIFILGSAPPDDPFTILGIAGPDVTIRVIGAVTPTAPSAFTAITVQNPATKQAWEVTDVAAAWGPDTRIAVPSGAFAWGARNLGVGVLRTSNWAIPNPATFDVTPTAPAVGPYVIQDLPAISLGAIQILGTSSAGGGFSLLIQDLTFYPGAFALPPNTVRVTFSGCLFQPFTTLTESQCYFLNCCISGAAPGPFSQVDGYANFHAGMTAAFFAPVGGNMLLESDFLFQSVHIEARGGASLVIGQAAAFDSLEHGLHIHPSCAVECVESAYGPARLWGTADAGAVGIEVDAGGLLRLGSGVTPNLTGGAGDFAFSGGATARAWDEGGGAYTAPISCSWANFDTTLLRNAHNVALASAIVGLP
jgi:hypothetical protein